MSYFASLYLFILMKKKVISFDYVTDLGMYSKKSESFDIRLRYK